MRGFALPDLEAVVRQEAEFVLDVVVEADAGGGAREVLGVGGAGGVVGIL